MNIKQQYLQNYYEIISVKKTLASMIPGSLRVFDRNDREVYQYSIHHNHKRHRKNLSHAQYIVLNDIFDQRIQLELRLKQLEERALSLELQLHSEHLCPLSILLEDQTVRHKQQQQQSKKHFNKMVALHDNPNSPLILTNSGIYVKSKSEAMIINQLLINDVTHFYEKPLQLNNRIVHPDVTLILPEHTKYWEHVGLVNDPVYMDKWWKKYQEYIDSGFLIGRDLIVTYEFEGFDSQFIQSVIDLQVLQQ